MAMYTSAEGVIVPSQNPTSVLDPPPPLYSAPSPQSSFFLPPSFEDVIRQSELDDPGRLPSYQSRQLNRYHPYWPYRAPSPSRDDVTRYYNTVFDDEYVPLDVPSRVQLPVPPPSFPVITAVPLTPSFFPIASRESQNGSVSLSAFPPSQPAQDTWNREATSEDEHRRRIYRLRAVMMRAIESSTMEEPAVDAEIVSLALLLDRRRQNEPHLPAAALRNLSLQARRDTQARMDRIAVLQQIVKTQAEQLSNIRQQLDASVAQNDLLWHELKKLHRELQSEQQHLVEPPLESRSYTNIDVLSEAGVPSEAPDAAFIASKAAGSLGNEDSFPSSEYDAAPFEPFCSKQSPWKILNAAKKASFNTIFKGLLVLNEPAIGTQNTRNVFIRKDDVGVLQKHPYNRGKWSKNTVRVHEVICRRAADWFYIGTYETSFSKILEPSIFEALHAKSKRELFALTSNNVKGLSRTLDLPSMYSSGELVALEIDCKRVGFDEAFSACLFEAAGWSNSFATAAAFESETASVWADDGDALASVSPDLIPLHNHSDGTEGAGTREPDHSNQYAQKDDVNAKLDSGVVDLEPRSYRLRNKPLRKSLAKKNMVHVKKSEFVNDPRDILFGFEVIPLQRIAGKKIDSPIQAAPQSLPDHSEPQEIILRQGTKFLHLGTYIPVSTRTLDVDEFESLPYKTKERVYRITAPRGLQVVARAAAAYASGEIKAVRVDFERVGLNGDVQNFLEDATKD